MRPHVKIERQVVVGQFRPKVGLGYHSSIHMPGGSAFLFTLIHILYIANHCHDAQRKKLIGHACDERRVRRPITAPYLAAFRSFSATAAWINALKACESMDSPSLISIALRVPPSKLALKRP